MVILDTNEASLHAEHMESEDKVDSWPDPCSTLQVGSWLTPATNLPKARASGLPACSALRFSHALKGRKAMKKKTIRATRFPSRRTVRMTTAEDERLREQAASAGLSVSEYIRRRMFGGRPIVAKTDNQAIRELRRLGGLLKHHFGMVRDTGQPEAIAKMNRTLEGIQNAIETMSKPL